MKGAKKTKDDLTSELEQAHKRIAQLETWLARIKRADKELREQDERIRNYLDVVQVIVIVLDRNGQVTLINRKGCALLGCEEKEVLGQNWFEKFLPESARDAVSRVFRKLMRGELEPLEYFENPVVTSSGEERLIAWHNAVLYDAAGNIVGTLSSGEDITERKRAEVALREAEERYRSLFEHSTSAMVMVGADGNILLANRKYQELTGYTAEELTGGMTILDIAAPEEAAEVERFHHARRKGEKAPMRYESAVITKAGERKDVVVTVGLIPGTEEDITILEDITVPRRAEKEIQRYQQQLRSLASELSLAEERERRRLAEVLHDEVGHALTLLKMKLGEMRDAASAAGLAEPLSEISGIVDQAINTTRSLTFEISPPILYAIGLEPALEWLTERFERRHGITCEFKDDGQQKPLDDDVCVLLFRAVRELLMNIGKHARATKARVSIIRDADDIEITVEDNGVGFDTSTLSTYGATEEGFGLFDIRERLEYAGGYSEVKSEPGRGTTVTLVAPVKTE